MSEVPPTEPRAKRHLRVIAGRDTKGRERDKNQWAGAQAPSMAGTQQPKQKTRVRSPIDPITGITQKQEAFVQGVASGLSLSAAYRAAFIADGMADQTVHHHACVLLTQGKVKARLEMISAEKEQMRRMLAVSDVEAALRTLRAINDTGSESGKLRAAELLAKAGGLWVDRIEVEDKTPADTAEVERRIAERLSRLGLTG